MDIPERKKNLMGTNLIGTNLQEANLQGVI